MEDYKKFLYGQKCVGAFFSLMMALFVFVSLVVSLIVSAFFSEGIFYTAFNSLSSILAMVLAIFIYSRCKKQNLVKNSLMVKFDYIYIVLAIVLSCGMFLGLGFANGLVNELVKTLGLKVPAQTSVGTIEEYITYILCLAILPAVVEELFFRGLLLGALEIKESSINKESVIYSLIVAVLFSLYHASIVQLIYQFVFGVFMCLLTVRAKSIIPAVISHFINNFAVLTFLYFKINIDLYNPIFISVGVALLVGFTLFLIFYNRDKKGQEKAIKQEEGISKKEEDVNKKGLGAKQIFIYALLGILISVAFIVGNLFV